MEREGKRRREVEICGKGGRWKEREGEGKIGRKVNGAEGKRRRVWKRRRRRERERDREKEGGKRWE